MSDLIERIEKEVGLETVCDQCGDDFPELDEENLCDACGETRARENSHE